MSPATFTSPISIQSPFGGSRVLKKLPDIGEVSRSSGTSHPKATPTFNESSDLQLDPQTMPINGNEKWEGHRERHGNKERRLAKTVGSSRQEGRGSGGGKHGGGGSQQRSRSQDDTLKLDGRSSEGGTPRRGGMSKDERAHLTEQDERLFSAPRLVSKGSPQLRRRRSKEELSSPNPDSTHHHGRRGHLEDRSLQVSRSGGAGLTRGNERSRKSPEIVIDDVSSSSLSTGSFDMSIQLLDISSPPQIILKAMENPE